MLRSVDFERENWEAVSWKIVSSTYVSGFILSECLPPPMFLDWLMDRLGKTSEIDIRFENHMASEGSTVWKLTVRPREGTTGGAIDGNGRPEA